MAALDFTDRAAVLAYLTAQLPDADEGVLEALLDASAGQDCGDPPKTVYRLFWVLASQLRTRLDELKRAKGASGAEVEYFGAESGILGHLRTQHALDQQLCTIPDGFSAAPETGVRTVPVVRTYVTT